MIFRLFQNLNAKIKAGRLAAVPQDENPLADWSANLFLAGRTQYILLANTKSLFCTVMPGKGITTGNDFTELALNGIRDLMTAAGYLSVYEQVIAPVSKTVRFAKALDRSITGSMNDMTKHAVFYLAERELPSSEIGPRLSEVPMSALRRSGSPYGFPRDVFAEIVNAFEE